MKRNVQLDFLRFVGVFLVMVNHIYVKGDSILDNVFKVIRVGGWSGVDLFFVLSGYLVSGLIIKEHKLYGSFNASRFLIRRGFKIYPTYYIFILFSFFLGIYSKSVTHKPTLAGLFHESVFVANYFSLNNSHLWSISVEEHFYFALALVFLLLLKYKKVQLKSFVLIYIFLLVIGIGFRLYNYFTYSDYDFPRDYTKSHFRFDALFFGVLIAYLVNFKEEFITYILNHKYKIFFVILSVILLSTNFIFDREHYHIVSVFNLAFNPICYGYLMVVIIHIDKGAFLKVISPLAYIGTYSYSIYLFHRLFDNIAIHAFKNGGIFYYLFYFSSAFIVGIIISKSIEYPIISIREKYFPSRSKKNQPVFEKGY
ncbi:acyltransferase family protein [Mucilaginibacter gotjawali]|uniref:O-acetyltransferase OatA n=2 Tax=Mucilaginibacter gotjawali TaxID=1550579 RepID=A0A110B3R6_9SPHI|nr:acyltransferase [Mucilaginibacter gotjawali]MBB3057474.1 peptidoglycan/LPS O-acetylase OafA/YrhL [Mucilaginibacter gotjawali]BAU55407.1 O-acetyltransferase OatA [Mucilaginibacter gotjawali]